MTTSTDCVVDLENITVILHSQQTAKFERFVWDDLSVNSTSSIADKDFNLFNVSDNTHKQIIFLQFCCYLLLKIIPRTRFLQLFALKWVERVCKY